MPVFAGDIGAEREPYALLAMQKVEGSKPFSRFAKACICRPFWFRQSPCSSASGRTDSGLAARRSSAASRKTAGLQADSRSSELKSFCRPKVDRSPAAATAGCPSERQVLAHGRLPARCPAIPCRGASPISVRYLEVDLDRTANPTSHGSHRRELCAGWPPRQRRGTRHGRLGLGNRSGSIAEVIAYIGSGRLLATRRAPAHRPTRQSREHSCVTG